MINEKEFIFDNGKQGIEVRGIYWPSFCAGAVLSHFDQSWCPTNPRHYPEAQYLRMYHSLVFDKACLPESERESVMEILTKRWGARVLINNLRDAQQHDLGVKEKREISYALRRIRESAQGKVQVRHDRLNSDYHLMAHDGATKEEFFKLIFSWCRRTPYVYMASTVSTFNGTKGKFTTELFDWLELENRVKFKKREISDVYVNHNSGAKVKTIRLHNPMYRRSY